MDQSMNATRQRPARTGLIHRIQDKVLSQGEYLDFALIVVVVFLLGFGLVMIYSTSSYSAAIEYGTSAYYFKRQGLFVVMGLAIAFVLTVLNYKYILNGAVFGKNKYLGKGNWVVVAILAAIVVQFVVVVAGYAAGGASRWMKIGIFRFQPSEFSKVILILYLAVMLQKNVWKLRDWKLIGILMIPVVLLIGLIALENLSTAIICAAVAFVMLFVACPQYKQFFFIIVGGAFAALILILLKGYRAERFDVWLHYETHEKGFQTRQALYAIGSGGLWGKGLGQSIQKMSNLPAAHNDMIFSVICEELGIVGGFALLLLFIILIWRLWLIATKVKELCGAMIVVGVLTNIAVQALINLCVVTNVIPNTGVPLPFVSYGGSSVLSLLIEIGLVLSVSRYVPVRRN